jgi:hypothetical protein
MPKHEGNIMTTAPTFSAPTKTIERDGLGRPKIIPTDGGPAKGYQRISNFSKALDDGYGLPPWYGRMTALGVARNAALLAQASVLTKSKEDKPKLNALVESAMNIAGAYDNRELGTALHRLAETADLGGDLSGVLPALMPDLDAYMEATSQLKVLAVEQFVVVDEFKVAGTFDRLYQLPDGRVVVGDLKTGHDAPKYPLSIAVQCGLYANGSLYDPETANRIPLTGVSTDVALLVHLPAGTGTCDLYLLDIRGAMAAAQVAQGIAAWRKKKLATPYNPNPTQPE